MIIALRQKLHDPVEQVSRAEPLGRRHRQRLALLRRVGEGSLDRRGIRVGRALGGPPEGDFDAWVAAAQEYPGSWWPDWIAWLAEQAPAKVPARKPGGGKLAPLADAPGEYVRVRV